MYVGVDGCPGGWVAVVYDDGYEETTVWKRFADLWERYRETTRVLVDVPVGLRTDSAEPRRCDTEARRRLSPHRHHSVFPTPVRDAAHEDSYEAAKATQERLTNGSLNRQTWNISSKIAEVDTLLLGSDRARETVRECHPEVCFWAFAGRPMHHSKTRAPDLAYWERVRVLRRVEPDVYDHLWAAGDCEYGLDVATDDLVDAFAVALTARGDVDGLATLPGTVDHDDEGLPMEIVYRDAG